MRICYVLDSNPERYTGGTPNVVRNIRRHIGGCVVSGSRSAIKNIFLMMTAPFRVMASGCDIVNIHDTQGYFCTFWPLKKKTVYTCHGLWKNYYKISPPDSFAKSLKSRMAVFFQGRILRKADRITAVSESVKKQIIDEYGIESERITLIHNGVDTDAFKLGKLGEGFIWVGDNPSLKGLDEALRYAKKRKKKITIVGVEGESSKDAAYLGKIGMKDMPRAYQTSDTLLFFSRFEGHPLVPLEAAACGLNIIASKESNIEIFPLINGIYDVKGRDAARIARKYSWKNQSRFYMEEFERVLSA